MDSERENYIISLDSSSKTYKDIAEEVNLTSEQVRYIFKKNKIKKKKLTKTIEDLSEEALQDILQNYNKYSLAYFIKKYDTSESVLRKFLFKNNIKKNRVKTFSKSDEWSEEEINLLLNNYQSLKIEELSELTGRSVRGVHKKLWQLNLLENKEWTSFQENFLIKNYKVLSLDALSFILERTKKSITHKISNLNLEKDKNRKTSIERIIESILNKHSISYIYNESFSSLHKYRPDFRIESSKLIIECQGDYFHANPEKYCEEDLTEKQKMCVLKDSLKKDLYEQEGYTCLFLWETDILENTDYIENLILEHITDDM